MVHFNDVTGGKKVSYQNDFRIENSNFNNRFAQCSNEIFFLQMARVCLDFVCYIMVLNYISIGSNCENN